MKNPTIKNKVFRAIMFSSFGGFLFFAAMLFMNYYVRHHATSGGEGGWGLTFIVLQGIPFACFLHLLDLLGMGDIKNDTALSVLASVADGLTMFLFLLICSLLWEFVVKDVVMIPFRDEQENQK